jgi:hypothetical protein
MANFDDVYELKWSNINHLLFSEGFEAIDPVVANAVTELFFLPVENMLRMHYRQACHKC